MGLDPELASPETGLGAFHQPLFEVSGKTPEGIPMRLALSVAVLAAFALPVHSQNEDAVVVTATRFAERLREAPIGVRIITAADIAASAATTLPELLSKFGGLHVRDNSGSPDKQIDLRGFGITSDQNTLVLVDGVRINQNDISATRLSSIPLQAIERIEILPSGCAVPYGAGATGGTVHIITQGPESGERSGTVSFGVVAPRGSETSCCSLRTPGKRSRCQSEPSFSPMCAFASPSLRSPSTLSCRRRLFMR